MGTDWNIRCRDCNEVGGVEFQRQLDTVRRVVAAAPHLAAAMAFVDVKVEYADWTDREFFLKHGTHRLVPHSEYGKDDGQCRKHVDCGECKTRHGCKLDENHDGPCERGERR